jgi:hypothetical protein
MVEPAARVTYVAFEPRPLRDAPFYRRRWEEGACRGSVLAFGRKWGCSDQPALVDRMLRYSAHRLREMEVRRPGAGGVDLATPMTRAELAQDRASLREQALARGYELDEARGLDEAVDLATTLFDGLYRPDGRPFLNHVIGVASALVRYDLELNIVRAGLLHAAISHRPPWMEEAELMATLSKHPLSVRLLRAQGAARAFLDGDEDVMSMNMVGAGAACILAANETDMRLSGEYRATGRPDDLTRRSRERLDAVLGIFGLGGLALSARLPAGQVATWPVFGARARHASFRLDPGRRRRASEPPG